MTNVVRIVKARSKPPKPHVQFMMRRDDLLSARERAVFFFSCNIRRSSSHTSQRVFFYYATAVASLVDRARFDGPYRQVQGHCTLIHGLFRKNPRYFSLSLSYYLAGKTCLASLRPPGASPVQGPCRERDYADVGIASELLCIHVVHSPPLLS